jgi:hypothetical protein
MLMMSKKVRTKLGMGAALITLFVSSASGVAYTAEGEPIFMLTDDTVSYSRSLAVTVGIEGTNADVNIYSNPPGVVSYEGHVKESVTTVLADTDTTGVAPGTPVTIYAETGGATVVSTTTIVE